MSYVMLVAADHPLPLYDSGIRRSSASTAGGACVQVETPGFSHHAASVLPGRGGGTGAGDEALAVRAECRGRRSGGGAAEGLPEAQLPPWRDNRAVEFVGGRRPGGEDRPVPGEAGRSGPGSPGAAVRPLPHKTAAPASAGWRSPFDFHLRAVLPGKEDQLWQAIASDASTRRSSGSCPL